LDGRPVGSLPMPRPARALPGTVTLRVTAPGRRPVERQAAIVAGSLSRESVELALLPRDPTSGPSPMSGAPGACRAGQVASSASGEHCCWPGQQWTGACSGAPRCPPGLVATGMDCHAATGAGASTRAGHSDATGTHPRRPVSLGALGGIGLGLGVALAGGGAVAEYLYFRGVADFNQASRGCWINASGDVLGDVACRSIVRDGHTFEALAVAGYVAGGIVGLTGIALMLVLPAGQERRRAAAFSCGQGPGTVGLACAGTF
ncbi:MAG: hypothetical protein WCJ30_25910, partial [Deltaproteobacteria bacterium]